MYDKLCKRDIGDRLMNPKAKKALIITGIALDILLTIALFVFSIVILVNMPDSKWESLPEDTFLGYFQHNPIMILLCDVLPLALLLIANISLAIWYVKKTGKKEEKKQVSLNDLSEEEKAALKQKILQEMMQNSDDSK